MNPRDELKKLSLAVSGGLQVYIDVHNGIFQEQATLKSLLQNLIGRGTPMAELLKRSEDLIPLWVDIQNMVEGFRGSSFAALSPEEKQYFNILARYVEALARTILALVDRQKLLHEGSLSMRNNHMTMEALKEKEREYRKWVENYSAIGQELNQMSAIIYD